MHLVAAVPTRVSQTGQWRASALPGAGIFAIDERL
jgi:hypothetical protein